MKYIFNKMFFIVLGIVIFYLGYFLLLPQIMDFDKYSAQIKKEVLKNFGDTTKIGNLKTSLLWNLRVKIDISEIIIKNKNQSNFISTLPVSIEIAIPELLWNKIKIQKITLSSPKIETERLPDGNYAIEDLFKKNPRIIFKNTQITATNYQIKLKNNQLKPPVIFILTGEKLEIKDFTPKKSITINTEGQLKRNTTSANFILHLRKKSNEMMVQTFAVKSHDIDVKLQGKIFNTKSKNPKLYLKLILKNTQVNTLSQLFPDDIKMHYDFFGNFRKRNLKSIVNANVDIHGTPQKPDLFGYLNFDKFSLTRNNKSVTDGIVKFFFAGKTYYIDSDILVAPKQHLYIKGNFNPQENHISLGVKGDKIELGPMQELLFVIRDIIKFDLGAFVSNSTLDGIGSINIYINGNSTRPNLDGYLRFSGCNLTYSGLSDTWKNVHGKVRFKKHNIYFDHIKTNALKSLIFIDGWIINKKIKLVFSSAKLNTTETRKLINESHDLLRTKKVIENMKAISGPVKATLSFGGNTSDHLVFQSFDLDILGGYITYEEVGFPIKLISGNVFITAKGTYLNNIRGKILKTPAQLQGQIIAENHALKTNYNVKMKNFPVAKIPHFMASSIVSEKQKQMMAKFKKLDGKIDADVTFLPKDYRANIDFHDASSFYKDWKLPLKIQKGNLKISSKEAVLSSLKTNIGGFDVFIDGNIKDKITLHNLTVSKNDAILMNAQGGIKVSGSPTFENFHLEIPTSINSDEINSLLKLSSQKPLLKQGYIKGNLAMNGPFSPLGLTGELNFSDIIPVFADILVESGNLILNPSSVELQNTNIILGKNKINISFNAEKNFSPPFKINSVQINIPRLNLKNLPKTKLGKSFPIEVKEGIVQINELLTDKISANNFSSMFCITPSRIFFVDDLQFDIAQGKACGKFCYNLKTKTIQGSLQVKKLDAESISSTLNMTEKISGKLSAQAVFQSNGASLKKIAKNTIADADIQLEQGHYGKLGKLQYLLMAQNTIMSGIGNLNINKILNLFIPQNLGDFDMLQGNISTRNGNFCATDINLQSKNLNIFANAAFHLKEKQSCISAVGSLPAVGAMNEFGNLSLNSMIKTIPAIGYIPSTPKEYGIWDSIPLIDKIPLLSGIGAEKSAQRYKRFVLRMCQDSKTNQSSKNLEWIKSPKNTELKVCQ